MQTQTIVDKNNAVKMRFATQRQHLVSFAVLMGMAGAIFLMDAVVPLRGLGFSDALLSKIASWTLWPTYLLFPQRAVANAQVVTSREAAVPSFLALSWNEFFFLFGVFLIVFLLYFLALFILARHVTYRYMLGSTLLLGLLYALIPVVASQDVFLYIGYARMEVIYHLNPLTTPPTAIHTDPVFSHIYWVHQPSIYGPTWIYITGALQWLATVFGFTSIPPVVVLLRLFGLSVHLSSTQLVWIISGRLQRLHGSISPRVRVQAVLAFAWNPLLLFEAVVNAHSDTTVLFFVLLALWLLVPETELPSFVGPRAYIGAAVLLALATCVKINIALLVPGLLLYVWRQPEGIRNSVAVAAIYTGTMVVLYAPFWQHGAILDALQVNPSAYRDVNTPAEFLSDFSRSVARLLGYPPAVAATAAAESVTRVLSMVIFVVLYSVLCWKTIVNRESLRTPLHLIRWMALAWLLYCAIGTPWFWPWYTVTFFGLFALVAAVKVENRGEYPFFQCLRSPRAVYFLAFSILSLYCFSTWGPLTSVVPWLPRFRWAYVRGLWAWVLPLLAFCLGANARRVQRYQVVRKEDGGSNAQ